MTSAPPDGSRFSRKSQIKPLTLDLIERAFDSILRSSNVDLKLTTWQIIETFNAYTFKSLSKHLSLI